MSCTPPPTIIELKAAFLRQQVHILSEPLRPSKEFHASSSLSNHTIIRPKVVEAALQKLHQRLKHHNRLAYGRRAQRHVAEQIDRLSWDLSSSKTQSISAPQDIGVETGTDYCASSSIDQLPDEWPYDDDKTSGKKANDERQPRNESEILRQNYHELKCGLTELNVQRQRTNQRLEELRGIRDTLNLLNRPNDVQTNLITRGCELEQELERMCRLILRIERGLSASDLIRVNSNRDTHSNDFLDIDGYEEHKLLKLIS